MSNISRYFPDCQQVFDFLKVNRISRRLSQKETKESFNRKERRSPGNEVERLAGIK